MSKIAVLIDSTFLFDQNYTKNDNVFIIPLIINFDNASFKEKGDTELLLKEIFTKVKSEKVMPKTSQPSVQDFLSMYEKIKNEGYDEIFGFYLSSTLSGTYQGAENAKSIFMEDNSDINITNFDSLNIASNVVAIYEILEYLKISTTVEVEHVQEILKFHCNVQKTFLVVDSLEYLALGGRISSSVAAIGNLFGIKPLLEIKEGQILEYDKVRSQKKAYESVLRIFEEEVKNYKDKTFLIGACNVLNEKTSKKLLNSMKKILEKENVDYALIFEDTLGPVIATHVGPGTVGISWSLKYV